MSGEDGRGVRQRREYLGVDKRSLAEHAGVNRNTLAAVENGENYNRTSLAKIERALDRLEETAATRAPDAIALPRGTAIQTRLDRLNMSDRQFNEQTGIDRKTLRRAIADDANVRPSTYAAIESSLHEFETALASTSTTTRNENVLEFELCAPSGLHVLIRGPVMEAQALEGCVARLIRQMQGLP